MSKLAPNKGFSGKGFSGKGFPGQGSDKARVRRALISVYNKVSIVELARGLEELGFEIISSGGTSTILQDNQIAFQSVESITGSPEILGGRVKTLHPKIHGGILADLSKDDHVNDLLANDISTIDLVICNLYPFLETPSVEMIDIGGPTMVRAGAKNFARVAVVVDPSDYDMVLKELRANGEIAFETRKELARKAFEHCANYDNAIYKWLLSSENGFSASSQDSQHRQSLELGSGASLQSSMIDISLERASDLRYGENPHQSGARFRIAGRKTWWDSVAKHSGLDLSYLNYLDTDSAWHLTHELIAMVNGAGNTDESSSGTYEVAVIVKHANPCGVAIAKTGEQAYEEAFECDPVSAFGGIVSLGFHVSESMATLIASRAQADVIIAPSFDQRALEVLVAKRKNTRILSADIPEKPIFDLRKLSDGFLLQENDIVSPDEIYRKLVTGNEPSQSELLDLQIAWLVCARTSSNSIVIANDGKAAGIGAGQQNRVDSARIAIAKAGENTRGGVAASDAFIPFRDTIDVLADAGIRAVIQPGGSIRDEEVIEACNEYGITLVFAETRHFRH